MSPKKPVKPLTEAPPDPSSEEDSSSTEIEEEEDAQQQRKIQPQNDEASSSSDDSSLDDETHKNPKKPVTDTSEEEEDDEGEEEVGEEEEEEQQTPVVQKPPKSMTSPSKSALKLRSKPVAATPEKEKRPLEDKQKNVSSKKPRKNDKREEKKDDKKEEKEDGSLKKQAAVPFQRLFSDEDEIVLLKGLIDFKLKRGFDPMNDLDVFYNFIKNSLECDCDRKQVVDKVRRLKKRYYNKKKKVTTPHENKIFELSQKIWENPQSVSDEGNVKGSNGVVENSNAAAGGKSSSKQSRAVKSKSVANGSGGGVVEEKIKGEEEMEVDGVNNWKVVKCDGKDLMEMEVGEGALKERLRRKGLKLMGEKARAELAEMWEKVVAAQMEVDEMRFEVLKEENRRMVEALKSGKL